MGWLNTAEGKYEVDWRSRRPPGRRTTGHRQSSNYGLDRATTDYGCPS
jgi:hypothetical protein